MNFHRLSLLLLFTVSISTAIWINYANTEGNGKTQANFSEEIGRCNKVSKEERFSCYRATIEKIYASRKFKNPKQLNKEIDGNSSLNFHADDNSYAVFGTNCHSFYHAVGDFIATNIAANKDPEEGVKYCSPKCTSGCVMGYYKRLALQNQFSDELLQKYFRMCPEGSEHQCSHEIGHILHDKYVTSILKPMDAISENNYDLKAPMSYAYTTFSKTDPNAPFEECKKMVPESELAYCYTGVGHNLFLFAEFSPEGYKSALSECDKTDKSHKNDCYAFLVYRIGINNAAVQYLAGRPDVGNKICGEVVALTGIQEMKSHCYLGIGGGIGLFLDSEFANIQITQNNISQIQKAVISHINMCKQAEEEYRQDCYRGLLGTKVKKLYQDLNLQNAIIEELLPKSNDGFQVVG